MFNNTTIIKWEPWFVEAPIQTFVAFNTLVGLVGIVSNLLVIISIATTPKLRSKTNYFLLSLAVTDILFLVVCIPLWSVFILLITGHDVYPTIVFFFLLFTAEPLFCMTLITTLVMISAMHFLMVSKPFSFDQIPAKRLIIAAFAIPWGLSIVLTAVEYAIVFTMRHHVHFIVIGFYLIFYILPLVVMITLYAIMIWKSMASVRSGLQSALENHRTVMMLILVLLSFIVFWTPYFVVIMTMVYCDDCEIHESVSFGIVRLLIFTNAAMNPCIYTYRSQEFRRAFRRILSKIIPCIRPPAHVVIEDKDMDEMTVDFDNKL